MTSVSIGSTPTGFRLDGKGVVMVLRAVKRKGPENPGPCDMLDLCPVCGGKMEAVYTRPHQQVCACADCQTTITVPVVAWDIARVKRKTRAPFKR